LVFSAYLIKGAKLNQSGVVCLNYNVDTGI